MRMVNWQKPAEAQWRAIIEGDFCPAVLWNAGEEEVSVKSEC